MKKKTTYLTIIICLSMCLSGCLEDRTTETQRLQHVIDSMRVKNGIWVGMLAYQEKTLRELRGGRMSMDEMEHYADSAASAKKLY